jgi:hypothetical protein
MDESMIWGEIANLTHKTQVEHFNFCICEDNEGNPNPYEDCPKGDSMKTMARGTITFDYVLGDDDLRELGQGYTEQDLIMFYIDKMHDDVLELRVADIRPFIEMELI